MKNYILGALVLLASLQVKTTFPSSTAECKPSIEGSTLTLTGKAGHNRTCVYTKPIPSYITTLSLNCITGNMYISSPIPPTVLQINSLSGKNCNIYLPTKPRGMQVENWNQSANGSGSGSGSGEGD